MVSLGIFPGSPVLNLALIIHWKQLKQCAKQHFYVVIIDNLLK